MDGESSEELSVLSGVPQGSVLGTYTTRLFLVHINEVTSQVSEAVILFFLLMHGIALYQVITSPDD